MFTEIADAKQKFKAIAERRKANMQLSEKQEATKTTLPKAKDPKAALAEINAAEVERRRSSIPRRTMLIMNMAFLKLMPLRREFSK